MAPWWIGICERASWHACGKGVADDGLPRSSYRAAPSLACAHSSAVPCTVAVTDNVVRLFHTNVPPILCCRLSQVLCWAKATALACNATLQALAWISSTPSAASHTKAPSSEPEVSCI
eukprot:366167-Chlamydomonas_euryale.AAC.17